MTQLPEIIRDIQRVSPDVVKKASTFQAAILADVAGRRGTMHSRVAPVHHSMTVAGPAFTVEGYDLFLISGATGHCLEMTNDADAATGILIATKVDDE